MFLLSILLLLIFGEICVAKYMESGLPCETFTVENKLENVLRQLKIDCSSKGLTEVPHSLPPDSTLLDLHGNNITTLPPYVFSPFSNITYLDLSNNHLSLLDKDTFRGLHNLEVLNLAGNKLCLPTGYPQGVFKDLTSLRILKTYSNDCPVIHAYIPDDVFKDLVALEKLSLDATENFTFGPGFKQLPYLTHIEANSYHQCEKYKIKIQADSFESLSSNKLSELTLRGCAYRKIDKNAFTGMTNLSTLNLACARNLNADSLFKAIHNMKHPTLETLILDGMFIFGKSSLLKIILEAAERLSDKRALAKFLEELFEKFAFGKTTQPFCDPRFLNLKRLSLRANMLAYKLNFQDNRRACMPYLHHLNLGMNPLFFGVAYYAKTNSSEARSISKRGVPVKDFWSSTNIRTIDVSGLYDQWYSFTYKFCTDHELDTEKFFRQVPKIVQDVPDFPNFNVSSGFVKSIPTKNGTDLRGIQSLVTVLLISPGTQVLISDSAVSGLAWDLAVVKECPYILYPVDTVVYLNFSNNDVSMLDCPILGIKSLRVLDGSNCRLTSFHVDVAKQKYVPNIELVYLQGNKLNNSDDFPEAFSEAVTLRELDLSHNGLQSLPRKSFVNLISLENLKLSNNMLSTVHLLLSNSSKLNVLDLSSNIIPYLGESFQGELESVFRQNPKFKLYLHANPLSCGCESIQFLNWFKHTNVTIEKLDLMTCENKTTLLIDVNTSRLSTECIVSYYKYYIIIGTLGTFAFIVIMISVVSYRRRWEIAWRLYAMKRQLFRNRYERLGEPEADKIYEAFVAYHIDHEISDDVGTPWVVNKLRYYVEEQWERKLFIFDRNATWGGSKIGEIIGGIQQSKKVVFVLTDVYLKKGSWDMILYWALRQGLDHVIMCCLGDVSVDKLPPQLAKVAIELQDRYPAHYLEFSVNGNDDDMWNNLKLVLDDPIENERTKIYKRQQTYT